MISTNPTRPKTARTSATPRVAVVGAGLGGLTCALLLRRGDIDVHVFEREASQAARDQGGTLDLHTETGQAALATAGLTAAFDAHARPAGQEFREHSSDGTLVEHTEPEPGDHSRPEIDRHDLRAILLEALNTATPAADHASRQAIHWNTPITAVTVLASGRARVEFTDPLHAPTDPEFDLVVGADGAWSRVRPAVSTTIPHYTGSVLVEAWFQDADRRHPAIARLVGHGMLAAFDPADPTTALIAQRNSDDRIRVYVGLRTSAHWDTDAGLDLADPTSTDAVAAHLLDRLTGWSPALRALIGDHDGRFVNRPIHMLPVGHRWDHTRGVTLLGDAAHLMPPAGEGANLALLDGADLATAILAATASGDDLHAAVRAYEHRMQSRGADAAARSARMLETA